MTAVLLTRLFLSTNGIKLMPLVIHPSGWRAPRAAARQRRVTARRGAQIDPGREHPSDSLRGLAARRSGLASGLALAVRPPGSAEVSSAN
jgi:hypothetical protein